VNTLLIFGLGYTGRAVADAAVDFNVMATSRSMEPPVADGSDRVMHLDIAQRQIARPDRTMAEGNGWSSIDRPTSPEHARSAVRTGEVTMIPSPLPNPRLPPRRISW